MVSLEDRNAFQIWENEGGSSAPARRASRRGSWCRFLPQDTSDGCRTMVAADLERAADEKPGWSRTRYENSAAMWSLWANWLAIAETPARRG